MFETEEFRIELIHVVTLTVRGEGLKVVDPEVFRQLIELAKANEDYFLVDERMKPEEDRRGVPHALVSAENLAKDACQAARERDETLVEMEDFRQAYFAKFCNFWPFCSPNFDLRGNSPFGTRD